MTEGYSPLSPEQEKEAVLTEIKRALDIILDQSEILLKWKIANGDDRTVLDDATISIKEFADELSGMIDEEYVQNDLGLLFPNVKYIINSVNTFQQRQTENAASRIEAEATGSYVFPDRYSDTIVPGAMEDIKRAAETIISNIPTSEKDN